MSLTIKHRKSLQGFDAAELERRAALARMADRIDEDPDGPMRMLAHTIVAVVLMLLGALLYFMPAIISWLVGR